MSRLLVFNLATDADDPLLAFTTVWLNRLAEHYDSVDVITMRAGRLDVARNVRVFSVGKERGWPEARRSVEFYRLLRARLAEKRYEACFAHMMPLFAVMGAPLLAAARVPITLWYTHRSAHWTVRAALPLVRRVVTAAPDSFPLPTPKLRIIGHGIDTNFFSPADLTPGPTPSGRGDATAQTSPPDPLSVHEKGEKSSGDTEARHALPLQTSPRSEAEGTGLRATVVHVARLMPIKHQATLIRAVAAVPGTQTVFIGEVPPAQDNHYPESLAALAAELGASDRVTFAGAQSPAGVRDAYRTAFAAVNLSPPGLFDKAALEAMACAVPTLVCNPAFDGLLGDDLPKLRVDYADDFEGLTRQLRALLTMSPKKRAAIGARLRERVVSAHSLDVLIPRLVCVLNTGEPE